MTTAPDYDSREPTQIGSYERPHQWLGKPKESHYIPNWYVPHHSVDLEIKCQGIPQGIKLRNVLPYRRWAIDGNGNVLPQFEFEPLYLRYLADWTVPETHSLTSEHIPNVLTWIRQRPDIVPGCHVDVAYVDDGSVKKEEKYTQDGELAPEFIAKDKQRAEDAGALKVLTQLLKDGKLSPKDFAAQAEAIMGSEAIVAAPAPTVEAAPAAASTPKKKGGEWTEARREAARQRFMEMNEKKRAEREARQAETPA